MNRQQRRNREREIDKEMQVLRKLPEKELLKMNEIINKIAKTKSEQALDIIDRSFSAVLVSEEWTFKEIKRLQDIMSDFMIEDQEKIKLLEKENIDMAKLQEEVKVFIECLIKEGKGRKEVIDATIFKFPKTSKTMVNNAYGKIQEELEIEDAAAYILEDTKELRKTVEIEEAKKVAEEVTRQLKRDIEHIAEGGEIVKEEKPISKLVIKKVELAGEFGTYTKEGNKVVAGEMTFNNLEELEEYRRKEIDLFNRKMEELREVYKII